MLIQCPRCSGRWRVADTAPAENPTFKCGRCHHLFRRFPGAQPEARAAGGSSQRGAPPEADNLEFIFPDRSEPPPERASRAAVSPPRASAPVRAGGARAPARAGSAPEAAERPRPPGRARRRAEDLTFSDELRDGLAADELAGAFDGEAPDAGPRTIGPDPDAEDDPAGTRRDDDDPGGDLLDELALDDATDDDGRAAADNLDEDDPGDGPRALDDEPPGRVLHVEDTMRTRSALPALARLLLALVALHAALALLVRAAPERARAWLARAPIAGARFADAPVLASRVQLHNVRGGYQRLKNARRVFVISGEAVNNSAATVDRIEVQATLYGPSGELDQKVVSTGNRTTLGDLSESEIALLQRLDQRIALAPGASTPFMIVFLEPPRELRAFSSRVSSVRPVRAATAPPGRAASPPSAG
jgi:predicted Zn finger-like uncharacterized protein